MTYSNTCKVNDKWTAYTGFTAINYYLSHKSANFQGTVIKIFITSARSGPCILQIYVFGEQINPQFKKKKNRSEVEAQTIVKSQGNSKGWPVFNIPDLSSPPRVPWSLEATGHRFFQYNPSPRRGPQPTRDPKSTSPQGEAPHRGYCPTLRSSHLSVSSPPAAAAPQGPVVTDTNHRKPRSWTATVSGAA